MSPWRHYNLNNVNLHADRLIRIESSTDSTNAQEIGRRGPHVVELVSFHIVEVEVGRDISLQRSETSNRTNALDDRTPGATEF